MAETSEQADPQSHEQCWECRRRRLVCDGTQPVCAKCRTAGIVCPGYADKKPLTWLAPGQVMSRARRTGRKKAPRKTSNNKTQQPQVKPPSPATPATPRSDSTSDDPGGSPPDDLLIGPPVELRPEVCDVFEAIMYYNARIYPDLIQNQLAPSGYVYPLGVVPNIPPSIIHTLVSMLISHRIIQMTPDSASNALVKPLWTRLYRHRDIGIRAIAELVGNEKTRATFRTIISVYTLLFATLQQSFTPCWRTHASAFLSLVHLRGTFTEVIRDVPEMQLSLMAMCIIGVLTNTTSPHNDQFHITSHSETLHLASTYYTATYFPSLPLPPLLFTSLIHINNLRAFPASATTTAAATDLLASIESFCPATWSSTTQPPELRPDWLLLASAFHSAVALFAILSLQSSGALPDDDLELDVARAGHARRLFEVLEPAMAAPRVRRRMAWPLVVAGVEAARAGEGVQVYIKERLVEMSRDQGSAPPLVARGVLERFWGRGGGRWDECFVEGVALVM